MAGRRGAAGVRGGGRCEAASSADVGGDPEAELAVAFVLEFTAGGLDDAAGGVVVDVAGDQGSLDTEAGRPGQRLGEHPGRVALVLGRRSDDVTDVAAEFVQCRCEGVPDPE